MLSGTDLDWRNNHSWQLHSSKNKLRLRKSNFIKACKLCSPKQMNCLLSGIFFFCYLFQYWKLSAKWWFWQRWHVDIEVDWEQILQFIEVRNGLKIWRQNQFWWHTFLAVSLHMALIFFILNELKLMLNM